MEFARIPNVQGFGRIPLPKFFILDDVLGWRLRLTIETKATDVRTDHATDYARMRFESSLNGYLQYRRSNEHILRPSRLRPGCFVILIRKEQDHRGQPVQSWSTLIAQVCHLHRDLPLPGRWLNQTAVRILGPVQWLKLQDIVGHLSRLANRYRDRWGIFE